MRLSSYIHGDWVDGEGDGTALVDPVSGKEIGRASARGLNIGKAIRHARSQGGPALRALSFAERAAMLRAVADVLAAKREDYVRIALENSGNTLTDAAIDIDGGIGTLKFIAGIGRGLGNARRFIEPGFDQMGKDESFRAAHVWSPLQGVAIHINAFNFPSWGLWEKAGMALLSGMPVIAKPATATCWLAQQMVKDVIHSCILPEGALSVICGTPEGLLSHVGGQDVVAFTGSADTAAALRSDRAVLRSNVRFNVEADSLNLTLLTPDVGPDAPEFTLLVKEAVREMTVKAGQKCTAIRRILVPKQHLEALQGALMEALARIQVGDPRNEAVRMGPLVASAQQRAAWEGLQRLKKEAKVVLGGMEPFPLVDADNASGCFFPPTLLRCENPEDAEAVHEVEVFGPVATLLPYDDLDQAIALGAKGGGSLVASVFAADDAQARRAMEGLAPHHGRVLVINDAVAKANTGHGIVMPMCVHGGPGRAGGGEELGGLRGLRFYHQRTAIQAAQSRLEPLKDDAVELRL